MENQIQQAIQAFLNQPQILQNIAKTLILLLILFVARVLFNRNVESWQGVSVENRRRIIVGARNFTVIVFLIGVFFIWGYQIKEFALSVAAVAIAFVMCFKEIIANFMGGVSRTISHEYAIGDRIMLGNYRGDVIDTDMLSTTILEIGPGLNSHQYTGNTIVFPNTLLLTTPVVNESFMQDYLLHVFHVPVSVNDDWRHKETLLLKAAGIICEPYLNKARKYMEINFRKISVDPPTADPRISIVFTKPDEVDLIVRVPVPSRRKGRIEQEIIRQYLDLLDNERETEDKIDL